MRAPWAAKASRPGETTGGLPSFVDSSGTPWVFSGAGSSQSCAACRWRHRRSWSARSTTEHGADQPLGGSPSRVRRGCDVRSEFFLAHFVLPQAAVGLRRMGQVQIKRPASEKGTQPPVRGRSGQTGVDELVMSGSTRPFCRWCSWWEFVRRATARHRCGRTRENALQVVVMTSDDVERSGDGQRRVERERRQDSVIVHAYAIESQAIHRAMSRFSKPTTRRADSGNQFQGALKGVHSRPSRPLVSAHRVDGPSTKSRKVNRPPAALIRSPKTSLRTTNPVPYNRGHVNS